MRFARFFTLAQNGLVAGTPLFLLPDKDEDGTPTKESDGEGIAYHDGYFYVIGSHSRSKKAKAQPTRHFLARIAIDPKTGRPADSGTASAPARGLQRTDLDYLIAADPLLKAHLAEAAGEVRPGEAGFKVDQHGPNIEGVAVAGGKVYVGFRGPIDGAGAVLYELPSEALFAGSRPRGNRHTLPLTAGGAAGQGIRDLAAVSDGLLILAGPEMRQPPARPQLYHWSASKGVRYLGELPGSFRQDSPEAIALLEETAGAYRLLVLADGDAQSDPVTIRVLKGS